MTMTTVTPVAGQWTLLASGPGTYNIQLRSMGTVKLREAGTAPVGEPTDSSNFWTLGTGDQKRVALAADENVYGWPSANGMYLGLDPFSTEQHLGAVGGHVGRASATFNKPAGTTPYSTGDLIANHATPASVVAMSFVVARNSGKGAVIRVRSSGRPDLRP